LYCGDGSGDDVDDQWSEGKQQGEGGDVAELTGDAGVDCFLEMFPGLSAAQVRAALEQHVDDAEATMFRLMSLHQRRPKAAQPTGTMGCMSDKDREAIRAAVLAHPSTIVTGGVASNPRLPPELFQTISKTRYRDGAVVTYKGEKVGQLLLRAHTPA